MASRNKKDQGVVSENKTIQIIDPIYEKFVKSVLRALSGTDFYEFFMDSLSRADNEFQFSNRRMEKIVDLEWVDAVEEALEGFQNIVSTPRNFIKEEELVVNVAQAKKAGSDVVRHLSTHAALVDDFNEDSGNVRPNKLMQKYREDSIELYENKLVFTTLEMASVFYVLNKLYSFAAYYVSVLGTPVCNGRNNFFLGAFGNIRRKYRNIILRPGIVKEHASEIRHAQFRMLFNVVVGISCGKMLVIKKPYAHIPFFGFIKNEAEIVPPFVFAELLVSAAFNAHFVYTALLYCIYFFFQKFKLFAMLPEKRQNIFA